ncbi:MAG: F0F1 ATP synthase subunit epsilon [Candidatus Muproteobacteria bacterium RIFCSPHIGHO2_12_FULL_60_33]|uniref:ATP synthase epsilon chain n=1 Tax=Candidatus Muproteobacteria bacterium RIFCSPLOWO2_01_FULL_60_18 TaxID=1817768 RepID=A0A1F6U6A4_9PROT|nr:MAG: F0F1 ATP synthase subunit epsilon [Candidatus Muproteobacteria bacterium RIFCSPHIGHO2_01_60_12]OGI52891.1 MAG: F0F1 ATP synthase subunit epsilon [Candidatus Muproteobacteria bacterium RIFCSPLOWO2_01_FULL_60_18]OGI56379.1 MAG: F0F1 ATP synthase subunit epsilon [Candidatus Muproteobacteria bacterium RIFCSPHIGHO2_12_FULL_60_33]OGI56722.1 MAG: F0F1 ATP synthase subunit epsilon [Candidatus Muproteobacteria bacterium RIFCSPHIGHO2_02_FULL_60_13]OGI59303.1 MAG: F0F1 ATP synthase subunit epsilon
MTMTIHVDIVSAEKEIYSGTAEIVFAPLVTGEVGILPRHAPLLARMKPGEVRVRTGTEELFFYVSGGLLEVQPHVVTVLADTALRAKDLDEAAALKAREHAEEALRNRKTDIDYAKAQAELAEAIAQLRAIQKLRERTRK